MAKTKKTLTIDNLKCVMLGIHVTAKEMIYKHLWTMQYNNSKQIVSIWKEANE